MSIVTIDIEDAWLSDPTDPDPTHMVQAVSSSDLAETSTLGGRIGLYGQQYRIITTDEDSSEVPLTIAGATVDEWKRVKGWRGVPLLLRHESGLRMIGAFLQAKRTMTWVSQLPGQCADGYINSIELNLDTVSPPDGVV